MTDLGHAAGNGRTARPIRVVSLRSTSYTGTTWINFILASHRDGFYLGPPDRVLNLRPDQEIRACLTHRPDCGFWNDFLSRYDRSKAFLPQLHGRIGGKTIYIANPTAKFIDEEVKNRQDIDYRELFVVRDGRAVLFSLMRHNGDRYPDFVSGLKNWLFPAMRGIHARFTRGSHTGGILRYEDVVANPIAALNGIGDFLGHGYDTSAVSYWDFEHHPTAGNFGTIDVYNAMRGDRRMQHKRAGYYDTVLTAAKRDPLQPKIDLEWLDLITGEQRLAYEALMGPIHGFFGYRRDSFEPSKLEATALMHHFAELKGYPLKL